MTKTPEQIRAACSVGAWLTIGAGVLAWLFFERVLHVGIPGWTYAIGTIIWAAAIAAGIDRALNRAAGRRLDTAMHEDLEQAENLRELSDEDFGHQEGREPWDTSDCGWRSGKKA